MSPIHGYRAPIEPREPDAESAFVEPQPLVKGPCLYLGPQGQRCDRPAIEDGFCARHAPGAVDLGPWIWFRRFAAILLTAAILWPIIAAFLNSLSHWRH